MVLCHVWHLHMHRLFRRASQSRRAFDLCAEHQSGHQLDLAAAAANATGRQCECRAILSLSQLQQQRRPGQIQFQGGSAVPRQAGGAGTAGDEGLWHQGEHLAAFSALMLFLVEILCLNYLTLKPTNTKRLLFSLALHLYLVSPFPHSHAHTRKAALGPGGG